MTNTTLTDLVEGEYIVTVSRAGYDATPEYVYVILSGCGTEEASFVLTESVTTKIVNLSAGWNMISVPVENATITLPAEAGAVYRYNGNIYETVADLGSVAPGEGFWMAATGGVQSDLHWYGNRLLHRTCVRRMEYDRQLFGGDCVLWRSSLI